MINLDFDVNALVQKVSDGLAMLGDKFGLALPNIIEAGKAYEIARGWGDLIIYSVLAIISIALLVFSFYLTRYIAKNDSAPPLELNVLIWGISLLFSLCVLISICGIGPDRLEGVVGAVIRIKAPEAALMIDAYEMATYGM